MRPLLILALALCACGKHEKTHPEGEPNTAVEALYETYSKIAPTGWYDADCDGLLFKSLRHAATRTAFPVELARDDVGKWYRDQDHTHCDPTSRDMHYGLWWYALATHRADLVDQDWSYGVAHAFVMDGRDAAVSTLLPDDPPTLALVEHRLGGAEHVAWKIPVPCVKGLPGFEGHLQMLTIGLRALMQAGDSQAASCAASYASAQPLNAFYQAVNGLYTADQGPAERLLSSGEWCPLDRLPTSADHCEPWLWQRDETSADWQPCPEQHKTHSGGDCLLAAAIALGRLQ